MNENTLYNNFVSVHHFRICFNCRNKENGLYWVSQSPLICPHRSILREQHRRGNSNIYKHQGFITWFTCLKSSFSFSTNTHHTKTTKIMRMHWSTLCERLGGRRTALRLITKQGSLYKRLRLHVKFCRIVHLITFCIVCTLETIQDPRPIVVNIQ